MPLSPERHRYPQDFKLDLRSKFPQSLNRVSAFHYKFVRPVEILHFKPRRASLMCIVMPHTGSSSSTFFFPCPDLGSPIPNDTAKTPSTAGRPTPTDCLVLPQNPPENVAHRLTHWHRDAQYSSARYWPSASFVLAFIVVANCSLVYIQVRAQSSVSSREKYQDDYAIYHSSVLHTDLIVTDVSSFSVRNPESLIAKIIRSQCRKIFNSS